MRSSRCAALLALGVLLGAMAGALTACQASTGSVIRDLGVLHREDGGFGYPGLSWGASKQAVQELLDLGDGELSQRVLYEGYEPTQGLYELSDGIEVDGMTGFVEFAFGGEDRLQSVTFTFSREEYNHSALYEKLLEELSLLYGESDGTTGALAEKRATALWDRQAPDGNTRMVLGYFATPDSPVERVFIGLAQLPEDFDPPSTYRNEP